MQLKISFSAALATCQGLDNHTQQEVSLLNLADIKHFHHHRKFCWTAPGQMFPKEAQYFSITLWRGLYTTTFLHPLCPFFIPRSCLWPRLLKADYRTILFILENCYREPVCSQQHVHTGLITIPKDNEGTNSRLVYEMEGILEVAWDSRNVGLLYWRCIMGHQGPGQGLLPHKHRKPLQLQF